MRRRITIAILALGGQGGGVLADWIGELAHHAGWRAQATSVPGVAQRTGATIYYLELFPPGAGEPVLALMPAPGDVDVVIASELMEAGRAMLRGFVSAERTTLIASTHRVYAISEKATAGDGRASSENILAKAQTRARAFFGFDMEAAASRSGAVISAVMFGALAASRALPFERAAFEAAIRAGGVAVESNLRGFEAGWRAALAPAPTEAPVEAVPEPTSPAGRALAARIAAELPREAHATATEGAKRLMEYQDARYATLYLDRLARIAALDSSADKTLTIETARYLALWMSYEDVIRVADLKTRASRAQRVREEVKLGADQIIAVTEFMHPRFEEVCDTLPAGLGRWARRQSWLRRTLKPLFAEGRHVETTSLGWFLALSALAALRPLRRGTLRYAEERRRIEDWLALLSETAPRDAAAARELAEMPRLIKGYGDTFERGLEHYERAVAAFRANVEAPDAAEALRAARVSALAANV